MCRQTRSNPRLRGFGQSGQDPKKRKARELHRLKNTVLSSCPFFWFEAHRSSPWARTWVDSCLPWTPLCLDFLRCYEGPCGPCEFFELRGTEMGGLQTAPEVLLNWLHNFDSGWKPHRTFDVCTRLHIANAPDYREPRIRMNHNVLVLLQSHADFNLILAIGFVFSDILSYFQLLESVPDFESFKSIVWRTPEPWN